MGLTKDNDLARRYMRPRRNWWRKMIGAGLMLVAAGCASGNLLLSSGPSPRVEDCMLLQQATPTRYVCNGKIYTATQLADIRKGIGTNAQP